MDLANKTTQILLIDNVEKNSTIISNKIYDHFILFLPNHFKNKYLGMRTFFLNILLICISYTFSQTTLQVRYSYDYVHDVSRKPVYCELTNSNNKSKFIIFKQKFDPNTIDFDDNDNMVGTLIDFEDEVFKDFSSNTYYSYSGIVYQKNAILKDSLNQVDWIINNKSEKNILGYKCFEARTKFKGRNYIAYFTDEIGIFDGPWKFSGLPGLILELYEENKMISFYATKIKIENYNTVIEPTLNIKNAKYWHEILEIAKKKYREMKNKMMTCCSQNSHIDTSGSLEVYDINGE